MEPEGVARRFIDDKLRASGWQIQDYNERNISLPGVAVREFPTSGRTEPVDYALFVQGKIVGIIEAKKAGVPLTGVESQSRTYLSNLVRDGYRPIFTYESTGIQTRFSDTRDPDYRSRNVLTFHRPDSLHRRYKEQDTLRSRLRHNIPQELPHALRPCQKDGIRGLEKSLENGRLRSLIHMTMGSGKTRMTVAESYRLLKFARARRILFLVDRRELGRQAYAEYQRYAAPRENKKFTDLYNVQLLTSHHIEDASAVVISTIQRLYSIISNTTHTDEEDELSAFGSDTDEPPRTVRYNNEMPIDMFDFIVVDEAHRSIYNKWRQVLEYFDAFVVGLTATPQDYTLAFFENNLVTSYTMQKSVLDDINVDYDCSRILTRINTDGVLIEEGEDIILVDRATGERQMTKATKEQLYAPADLDRKIEAEDHIRKVIESFKHIQEEAFKRPKYVPKTLVFAKTLRHADTITSVIRDTYGKGNEFCRSITSATKNAENIINDFKNSVDFRIAVSVDMLGTGFDMPSLECLLFMRRIESSAYAEQMAGRGCRTINSDLLREITPDAAGKDSYLIVDAAGALDALNSDRPSRLPTNKNNQNLGRLLNKAADGRASSTDLEALAIRLNTVKKRMSNQTRDMIEKTASMKVEKIIDTIRINVDADNHRTQARQEFGREPTLEQIQQVKKKMLREASKPFYNPSLRAAILEAAKRDDLIVTQKQDEIIGVYVANIKQHHDKFVEFLQKHRDRLVALQIIYNTPYRLQDLTFQHLDDLSNAIKQPPYNLTPEKIWRAYESLGGSRVKNNAKVQLTDIISLVRYESGNQNMLAPYSEFVMEKFEKWLETQKASGALLTHAHETWLRNIAEQISVSCRIDKNDIRDAFHDVGGLVKFYDLFPNGDQMLIQMHEELTNFEE